MKVIFLTGEYPPMQGGIADHTAHLSAQMAHLGVESLILTSHRWEKEAKQIDNNHPGHIGSNASVFPVLPNWSRHCWPGVSRFLEEHQPDILHIQYQAAAFDLGGWINWLPWYLKKRHAGPTKIVTTFHDLRIPYIFPKAGRFRWKSVLALAHYSDAVICTDRENVETLQHAKGHHDTSKTSYQSGNGPMLTHIPLGNNVEPQPPADYDRAEWRARYNATDDTLLLAYFGFLNQSKGGEELVESLALLRKQGIDAHLLLIGGDVGHVDPTNVAYAQKVDALVDQHNLADFVHRTGYVEEAEVSANLLAADAVVMPYRDGVSFRRTTLIAALRHGCPIVSTFPSNPRLIPEIEPGENMLLAPPQNAEALAQTIAKIAEDSALRKKLSEGSIQLGSLFEWDRIASSTAALYQAITRTFADS